MNHLTRLVDDLLDISRITRARIDLRRQDVSLGEVIGQALETVEPMLREKQHEVTTTSGLEPLIVNGDPARLVPGGGRIRLIALTGYGQSEDRRRALAAGFDDHLVKPVEPAKLAQALG